MAVLVENELDTLVGIYKDNRITKCYELNTYVALKLFADLGINNPSMSQIALIARCNVKSASKAVKVLEETGWIKRIIKPLTTPVYKVFDKVQVN